MNNLIARFFEVARAILGAVVAGKTNETIKVFTFEITRPADTTPYSAGDVIANSDSSQALPYVELDTDTGADVAAIIAFVRVQTNTTTWAAVRLKLHLFRGTITPQADNAAYAMLYSNAPLRNGSIDVTFDAANGGGTDSVAGMNNYDKIVVEPAANRLYFQLQILDAKTPVSGQKFLIQIGLIMKKY
ncbi:MAG: hypothetical protein PHQ65_07810 [Bacteroidales bacterium]|nr:hypothetical protein [Bacteroidales bacterium]MDD3665155.1 hypothetical protein [Bacteroidales bacterium]